MKKIPIILSCILLILTFKGCTGSGKKAAGSQNPLDGVIPANTSVNAVWGGQMCEAGGYVYYASGSDSNEQIIRMKPDGTGSVAVTGEYSGVYDLITDGANLYFVVYAGADKKDMLYSLPLKGGKTQKILEGNINISSLQYAKGRLYWEDITDHSSEFGADILNTYEVKSSNTDGSDLRTLYAMSAPADSYNNFHFLATDDGLFILHGVDNEHCDLYHMDLAGHNAKKINRWKLKDVDVMFYDQGKIYYLKEHFKNWVSAEDTDTMYDSVESIDAKGRTETVLDKVGYYPQDFGMLEYCGISNGVIYYLDITDCDGSGDPIFMDLHSYDIGSKTDTVQLHNIDMGEKGVGTIYSLRGKRIKNKVVSGMFIAGDDVYFAPHFLA